MKFLIVLLRDKKLFDIKFLIIMSIIGGITNAIMLGVINSAAENASNQDINLYSLITYAIAFAIFFISKKYALSYSAYHVEEVVKRIKRRISYKIRDASLSTLDQFIGHSSSIYKTLTQDTNVLSYVGAVMITSAQSTIMIIFALMYLFYISTIAFLIIFFVIIFGSLLYLRLNNKILQQAQLASDEEKNFVSSMQDVLYGFKEIKINRAKGDGLFDVIEFILEKLHTLKIKISLNYITITMFFEVVLYLLLATIIFVIPNITTVENAVIIKIIATILFIMSPLEKIIDSIPLFGQADIAINNINALEAKLDHKAQHYKENSLSLGEFEYIKFKEAIFEYKNQHEKSLFKLGTINLEIHSGQSIYIVGGNGSGKSTFIKLLLGLYLPNSGTISMNKTLLDMQNIQNYRDYFSIVLTDFHLFDKLYGLKDINKNEVDRLLRLMQLDQKTQFIDGGFTNKNLSTGQRKRLALIHAILEDKQIYVFDEWAADQDPEFRRYFYTTILKDLKDRGKTLIVVTHDDQYFDLADKIYKLEFGNIREYDR